MLGEAKKKEKKINRNSTLITLVGIALISALSYWVMSVSVSPLTRSESVSENERLHPLKLMAFQRTVDGLTKPLDHLLLAGETVIFKLASVKPLVIALAIQIDEEPPILTFQDARIPPGPERLVAKFDGPYQYTATPGNDHIRVCVIGGSDKHDLDRQLAQLNKYWSVLPATSCVQLR